MNVPIQANGEGGVLCCALVGDTDKSRAPDAESAGSGRGGRSSALTKRLRELCREYDVTPRDVIDAMEVRKTLPPVLDACCGSRMFWFDKGDGRALFMDKRRETHEIDIGTPGTIGRSPVVVNPDVLANFGAMPFPDASFALVLFDPPHIPQLNETAGILCKKYGSLFGDWREELRLGFAECFRVLRPHGTLIFKWNEARVPVAEILALTPEKPLFGHQSGKQSETHWIAFLKGGGGAEHGGENGESKSGACSPTDEAHPLPGDKAP